MIDCFVAMPPNLHLEECPFCGGSARLFVDFGKDHQDAYYAGCSGNGCIIMPITLSYATKRDAIRAWNLRGPQSKSDPIVQVGCLVSVKGSDK